MYSRVTEQPVALSRATTVNVAGKAVPEAVPEIRPKEEIASPSGKFPALTEKSAAATGAGIKSNCCAYVSPSRYGDKPVGKT